MLGRRKHGRSPRLGPRLAADRPQRTAAFALVGARRSLAHHPGPRRRSGHGGMARGGAPRGGQAFQDRGGPDRDRPGLAGAGAGGAHVDGLRRASGRGRRLVEARRARREVDGARGEHRQGGRDPVRARRERPAHPGRQRAGPGRGGAGPRGDVARAARRDGAPAAARTEARGHRARSGTATADDLGLRAQVARPSRSTQPRPTSRHRRPRSPRWR